MPFVRLFHRGVRNVVWGYATISEMVRSEICSERPISPGRSTTKDFDVSQVIELRRQGVFRKIADKLKLGDGTGP